jgi:hypothetical protein
MDHGQAIAQALDSQGEADPIRKITLLASLFYLFDQINPQWVHRHSWILTGSGRITESLLRQIEVRSPFQYILLSGTSLTLTFLATHIILSGESDERLLDSQSLTPVPQNKINAIVAMLRSHKHLFEATVSRKGTIQDVLFPGHRDFCCLFRVKVPVSISLSPHQRTYT